MKGFKHDMPKEARKRHKQARKERQRARGRQWSAAA